MNKRIKIVKLIISLILVIILSINSFAAIVSDNDGSAFVTKAEFDALKTSFSKQISNYNTSIDGKIDGAIAQYLSGINLSIEPDNIWEKLVDGAGEDVWFANTLANSTGYSYSTTWGSSTNQTKLSLTAQRHYTYLFSKMKFVIHVYGAGSAQRLETAIIGSNQSAGAMFDVNSLAKSNGGKDTTAAWDLTQGDLGGWTSGNRGKWVNNTAYDNVSNMLDTSSINTDGSGVGWIYHKRNDGNLILQEYATKICPAQVFDVQYHTYKSFSLGNSASSFNSFTNWYTADNKLGDTTVPTAISVPSISQWGSNSSGTKKGDNNTTASSSYYKYDYFNVKSSIPKYFANIQFGKTPTNTMYCYADNIQPVASTTQQTKTISQSTFNSIYYTNAGGNLSINKLYSFDFKYYPISYSPESKKLTNFIHEQISSVAGEIVLLGGGSPLFESMNNESNYRIKLKFKARNSATNGNVSSGTVSFQLSDKQFNAGALSTGAKNYLTVTNAPLNTSLEYTITNATKGIIWINMYSDTTGYDVTLDSFELN